MWAIGPYRLDPASFELTKHGASVDLQRRPLDLLLHLIARPRQVISREELERVVWCGVVVSKGALNTAIYEARVALGDLDRAPADRWVETVRGRGFRFRGPVERIRTHSDASGLQVFVGRTSLLADLIDDLRRAESGQGRIRVIEGIAGMGKTRLVQEATRDPGTLLVHTVYCEQGGPPYWPWTQLVRVLSGSAHDLGKGESRWLFEGTGGDDATHFQFERLQWMMRVLSSAAERTPRALVIEDIHWADTASMALLESLAPRIASLPVSILATHRMGEEVEDPARGWIRSPHIQRDRLEPLDVGDLYQLVGELVGRLPSPEFVGWIQRHSGGVPLMVRELAEQADEEAVARPDVPHLAQALLERRFERLSGEERRAIAVAGLCGERFELPLVEAATEGVLDRSRGWVRKGLTGGILVADARNPLRFAFRHALLREASEAAFGPEEAAEWHGRLARVLEQQHPDPHGAAVSQLAHHWAHAALVEDDLERPLRYALLAARDACGVFAWEEVRVHSERALSWVRYMAPGRDRDAQELDAALLRCAGIATYTGHVEETDRILTRIEPILERAGDVEARALAEGFRFANARSLGDFRQGLHCAEGVDRVPGLAPVGACWRLGIASLAGDLDAAIATPAWEDDLGDDRRFIDYARRCGRDPEVDRLGLTAYASWALGRDAEALERAERARRWAEDRGDARSGVWALFMLCMLHELRRDWTALAGRAPEIDEQAARHRVTPWLGVGTALHHWARSREKAEPVYPGALFASILRDRGHSSNVSLRTMLLLLSSRIYARAADLSAAEATARDGLGYCEKTDERHMAPELERQLARVLDAAGQGAAAGEARSHAVVVARAQGNLVSEVRTRVDRIEAGEADPDDHVRLSTLRKRMGARFGPHERKLLDRLPGLLERHR